MSIESLGKEFVKYLDDAIKEYNYWAKQALKNFDNGEGEVHTDVELFITQHQDMIAMRNEFKKMLKKHSV